MRTIINQIFINQISSSTKFHHPFWDIPKKSPTLWPWFITGYRQAHIQPPSQGKGYGTFPPSAMLRNLRLPDFSPLLSRSLRMLLWDPSTPCPAGGGTLDPHRERWWLYTPGVSFRIFWAVFSDGGNGIKRVEIYINHHLFVTNLYKWPPFCYHRLGAIRNLRENYPCPKRALITSFCYSYYRWLTSEKSSTSSSSPSKEQWDLPPYGTPYPYNFPYHSHS